MSVLLIAPRFFNYEKAIVETIEENGGKALYIDERPGNSFFIKGMIRTNANLIRPVINKYYAEQLSCIRPNQGIDRVLIISPEAIDESNLKNIKSRYPQAEMILYMWDSIRNKTGGKKERLLPYFDRIFSFDKEDCDQFPAIKFRPLFFRKEFEGLHALDAKTSYDISFIGTIHSDRFAVCSMIKKQADKKGLSSYFYLYLQDRKLFWYSKMTNASMKDSKESDFSYIPMPSEKVIQVIGNSKCILDIQHPKQTGLTIRTIEILGAKRKLLTTNNNIIKYDFYRPNNIQYIDRNSPVISNDLITSPYSEIDCEIYNKYTVDGWLNEVLGN